VAHRDQLELLVALSYYEHERDCEHSRYKRLMWAMRDQNNVSNLQDPGAYLCKLCSAILVERTSGETWGRVKLADDHWCMGMIFTAVGIGSSQHKLKKDSDNDQHGYKANGRHRF